MGKCMMWFSFAVGVVGILDVIIKIVKYFIKKKYPAEITCDIIDKISVSAPSNLGKSKISLLIDGTQVDKKLTYIKYMLVSVGSKDVVCDKEDKIEFQLPSNGRWLSFDVINESNEVGAITEIKTNCAYLRASKLRINESIIVEGLYECNDVDEIGVTHRIQNTQNIKIKETLLETSIDERLYHRLRIISTVAAFIMTIGLCELVLPISPNYYIKNDGSTRVYVEAQLKDTNLVYVKEPGHAFDAPEPETMSYADFAKHYKKYPKTDILIRNSYWVFCGMIVAIWLFILVRWIGPIRRYVRRQKNRKTYNELMLAAKVCV